MGMNLDWSKILGTLIAEVIKVLTPWAKDAMEELIDWAYKTVEQWAKKLKEKPASTEKMAKAVGLLRVMEPAISEPEARILLEAKHLDSGTTSGRS